MLRFNLFLVCLLQGCALTEGIVLRNIDPSIFNFASDVVADISNAVLVIVFCSFYTLLMSLHLKSGHTVPVSSLGEAPQSVVDALKQAKRMDWPKWLLMFATLLAVARLSHAVADLGLGFTNVVQEGDTVRVMTLDPARRNAQLLFQSVGDPYHGENLVTIEGELSDDILEEDEQEALDLRRTLTTNFVAAIDGIARGNSHVLSQESLRSQRETGNTRGRLGYAGLEEDVNIFLADDDKDEFIAGLNYAIPLPCQGMVQVNQSFGFDDYIKFKKTTSAQVPDCNFGILREGGIYEKQLPRAEITGWLQVINDATIYNNGTRASSENHVGLIHEDDFVVHFRVKQEYRTLARERDDWRKGREILGFEALKIGSVTIPLGRVVLASGREALVSLATDLVDISYVRRTEYKLISEVQGDCPPDPAGILRDSCFAVTSLYCDTFPEDFMTPVLQETFPETVPASSACTLFGTEFLWGRNLQVDADLVTAIAGIYGRNWRAITDVSQGIDFTLNVALAAMFSLGTIEERSIADEVVRPTINAVYIIFMALPLTLGLLSALVTYCMRGKKMRIPTSPWENMILGTEIDFSLLPPGRMDVVEKFPEENDDLRFGFIGNGPNPVVAERESFRTHHINTSNGTLVPLPLGAANGNTTPAGPSGAPPPTTQGNPPAPPTVSPPLPNQAHPSRPPPFPRPATPVPNSTLHSGSHHSRPSLTPYAASVVPNANLQSGSQPSQLSPSPHSSVFNAAFSSGSHHQTQQAPLMASHSSIGLPNDPSPSSSFASTTSLAPNFYSQPDLCNGQNLSQDTKPSRETRKKAKKSKMKNSKTKVESRPSSPVKGFSSHAKLDSSLHETLRTEDPTNHDDSDVSC